MGVGGEGMGGVGGGWGGGEQKQERGGQFTYSFNLAVMETNKREARRARHMMEN